MSYELAFKVITSVEHRTFSFCLNASNGETYYVDYTRGVKEDYIECTVVDYDGEIVEEDTELYKSILRFCDLYSLC